MTEEEKLKKKEYDREYYTKNKAKRDAQVKINKEKNKEIIAARNKTPEAKQKRKEYLEKNKDKINAQRRANHRPLTGERKCKMNETSKKHYEANKEEILERGRIRRNQRYQSDINFKIKNLLRNRLRNFLKDKVKVGSFVSDLGCSVDELKIYIESLFTEGMTWENYTKDGWHLDHIIPLSAFDLTNREEFLIACHYTNLQPLWAIDNLKKNDKIPDHINIDEIKAKISATIENSKNIELNSNNGPF